MHSRTSAFVAVLMFTSLCALGCAPGWRYLGSRDVGFRVDRDVIPVTGADGRFSTIGLEVTGNDVEILDLQVSFGNGDVVDVPVRQRIPRGGRTRAIDLPGNLRVIRAVTIVYRTEGLPVDGNARISLYGLR